MFYNKYEAKIAKFFEFATYSSSKLSKKEKLIDLQLCKDGTHCLAHILSALFPYLR